MMLANRFFSLVPFLALSLAIGCDGCDGCGDDEAETGTATSEDEAPGLDPSTIPVPEELLLQTCAQGDWPAVRAALGPILGDRLPEDAPAALTEVTAEASAFAERVGVSAAFCSLSIRERGDTTARLVAVRLGEPLTGGEPGAPGGGRWLAEGVAMIGDALVAGSDRELVDRHGAYAALRALGEERSEPVSFFAPEGVVSGDARTFAEEALAEWARAARASIARERDEHGGPPELGDPEAVVALVEELGGTLVRALGDVGAIRAAVDLEGDQLGLVLRAPLAEGSAFAEMAEGWPAAPHHFDRLPRGTALAYFRAGLGEGETTLAAMAEQVAGERLGAAEREALTNVAAEVHDSPRTLIAGGTEEGPFLLWRARGEELEAIAAPLRQSFAAGYLAMVASAASGCAGSGARLAGRASGRCPEAPVSALRGSSLVVAPEGHLLLLEDGRADRAIGALATDDSPVVAALALVPSALPATVRLVKALPPLGELPQGGAIVATLRFEEGSLVVQLKGTSDAVSGLLALIGA